MIHCTPPAPASLAGTGVSTRHLLNLMLKLMHVESLETVPEIAARIKLPHRLVQNLIDEASQQRYIQSMGTVSGGTGVTIRYALVDHGKAAAKDALEQNLYLGPAPVALADYQNQIRHQLVSNELIDRETLRQGFADLTVSDHYFDKLLPAIRAGRSMLLFGPPGNGKTTLTKRIATLLKDVIYIPYAVDVAGQIIKVFDPALHRPVTPNGAGSPEAGTPSRERCDERWVACLRPVVVAGGELTLEMLDLRYNPDTRFYDAPLHIKALNGLFLIDDFGRQRFSAATLLNRWIVPLEDQVDYFQLNAGLSFSLPFDELLVFSTNLKPSDLMDAAFLRRIPYKIKIVAPSRAEYRKVFENVAQRYGLTLNGNVFDFVVNRLTSDFGLAYYQPKFICEQVVAECKCNGMAPELTSERASRALANLYFDIEDQQASD